MSPVEPVPTAVVYDVNVLVTAVASGNSPFRSWPSPPPTSATRRRLRGNHRRCRRIRPVAVAAHPRQHQTSPGGLFKWEQQQAGAYVAVISEAAEHSGGGLLADIPRTVHDCPDHEDNLVLDLAAEVGAMLIVSNDIDLLSMSPWRGTPILTPIAFAAKVDAMRRHTRRRRR